jgi:hypothetical protein
VRRRAAGLSFRRASELPRTRFDDNNPAAAISQSDEIAADFFVATSSAAPPSAAPIFFSSRAAPVRVSYAPSAETRHAL